ncbi:competence protein CoiA family protein [Microbulbifer sp. TRSA002]|uniref:competence protein CoiA family protein n=1 Tax=Microbulbifer sp. TRSA002 TaxID=3243382 RepID=UPI00403A0709
MSTLIPFAINRESGELCGVEDVPRGRSCNCVCPSCGQSVVARRGEKVEWHFAHDSRAEVVAEKECDLSFESVCAQMLRQMLLSLKNEPLSLPDYIGIVELVRDGKSFEESIPITKASNPVVSEYKEFSIPYTLVAAIQNHELLIDVIYRERAGITLEDYPEKVAGHLELDVSQYASLIERKGARATTYKAALRGWIIEEHIAKKWLYHANEEKKLENYTATLKAKIENELSDSGGGVNESMNANNEIFKRQKSGYSMGPTSKNIHETMRIGAKERGSRFRLNPEDKELNIKKCCLSCRLQFVTKECPLCLPDENTRIFCARCRNHYAGNSCPRCEALDKSGPQVFSG